MTYYRPVYQSHLWIYRPIRRTDLFILSGDDLEYTKKILLKFDGQ